MAWANEREVAANILTDMQADGSYGNLLLRKTLNRHNAMLPAQKAFITGLVNGVLRNLIYIDYIIDQFSKTKTSKMKPFVLNVLRLSVYQFFFMDKTPDFAVCNEAVALVKKRGLQGLAGFVNGVLRGILRGKDEITLPADDTAEYLSVRYSCPMWLTKRFIRQYGFDNTKDMLLANTAPPDVTLFVNTLRTTKEALIDILIREDVTVKPAHFMMESALHVSGTSDMTALPSFAQGLYHVMDESAMCAVDMAKPTAGMKIFDLCAAPGGKSFAAAILAEDKADISARDIYEHKIDLISSGAARLGVTSVKDVLADAEKLDEASIESADLVLVDAPCSGFGLLRKKPDIRMTRREEDIMKLAALQKRILRNAVRYVKPGGTLLYSTCTLTQEENESNADWLAREFSLREEERRTIFPQEYGTDGFFIARFTRE